jgi:hypothetical protein
MAGKRVKCKYCGVVFLIAADARSADAGIDLSALDELNAMSESGKAAPPKRAGAGAAGGEDIDSLFHCEYPSEGAPRTNKLYVFPMSRLLDRWLPPLLLAVGLVWAVREAFERNETGRVWVGFFRSSVFLLAFFASVFPFTLMGVRRAACKLNYELPPRPGLRAMGVYAVPFALACAMWMILGGGSGLMIGLLIGAVVALPLLFLLFRLMPGEAPVTFAYATGSFLLSVVVAVAAVFALNMMLVGTLRATKTEHALAVSPFGPNLQWDGPFEKVRQQIAQAGPGPEPESPTTVEAATTAPTTGPATSPAAATGPSSRSVVATTGPSVPTQHDVMPPADAARAVALGNPPAQGNANDRQGNANANANPGIVAEQKVVAAGGFKQVVYPATPGARAAVVREGRPGHDHVELWDLAAQKAAAQLDVPRSPEGNAYALGADGEYLCYVTDFPRLELQVWSFSQGKLHKQVDLEAGDDRPRLLGFCAPDQVLLYRLRNGQPVVQVLNVKAGGRPRSFTVNEQNVETNRFAISPDGATIAFIVQGNNGADLESYTLATGRPSKQMPIVEVNWTGNVIVSGLAFSPDSQRIAAVFADGQGAGFFVEWPAAGRGGKAVLQQFLPVGVNPPPAHLGFGMPVFEGRAFHWLENGRAWLLYGGSVFDTDSGSLLGSLGLSAVRSQYTVPSGDTCQIVRNDEFGGLVFTTVELDLPGARQRALGGTAPPPARGPAR